MAKAKYKIGTMAEVAGKGFVKIDAVITRKEGFSYQAEDGAEFKETDIFSAYRPVTARIAKTKTTAKRTKKQVAVAEEMAAN